MRLTDLKSILEQTGFPVAYQHFIRTDNEPLPNPPFIVYMAVFSSHFNADNKVYMPIEVVQIELYTDKKDLEVEAVLESVLNENELPYSTVETFIESENLFQKIYEVRLFINGR